MERLLRSMAGPDYGVAGLAMAWASATGNRAAVSIFFVRKIEETRKKDEGVDAVVMEKLRNRTEAIDPLAADQWAWLAASAQGHAVVLWCAWSSLCEAERWRLLCVSCT